jgi:2-polyprenyl-3-methyl-5-hydroxy-6-metoxy-1,4-benzoquinol methylase
MNDYQAKLFNKFHDTGLGAGKSGQSLEAHFKHIASTYDWNYKNIVPEDKNARILDIGCGLGEFLYWLNEKGYKNFLGVDVSQQMLDIAKQNASAKVKKISSIKEYLGSEKEGYDLIVMNDVIEHLTKQEIIDDLEMMRSALKKGGQLIIKTNNLAAITGARMRYSDFTHELGLTEYSLKQILALVGFSDVAVKPFAMPLTNPLRYIRFIMQKISNLCWKLRFWINFTPVPEIVDEMIMAIATK